jgi:hypothetical protein
MGISSGGTGAWKLIQPFRIQFVALIELENQASYS